MKIPGVVQVALISGATVLLGFAIEFFGLGGQGATWEWAPVVVLVATALLRTVEVYRARAIEMVDGARKSIAPMIGTHRSTVKRILLGD